MDDVRDAVSKLPWFAQLSDQLAEFPGCTVILTAGDIADSRVRIPSDDEVPPELGNVGNLLLLVAALHRRRLRVAVELILGPATRPDRDAWLKVVHRAMRRWLRADVDGILLTGTSDDVALAIEAASPLFAGEPERQILVEVDVRQGPTNLGDLQARMAELDSAADSVIWRVAYAQTPIGAVAYPMTATMSEEQTLATLAVALSARPVPVVHAEVLLRLSARGRVTLQALRTERANNLALAHGTYMSIGSGSPVYAALRRVQSESVLCLTNLTGSDQRWPLAEALNPGDRASALLGDRRRTFGRGDTVPMPAFGVEWLRITAPEAGDA
jgi:hypothetical protein